jgi:two-component system CheB/CheR fusion protein
MMHNYAAGTGRGQTLRERAELLCEQVIPDSAMDVKELLEQLNIFQIELEMQNEELRRTQEELEASRRHLADLFAYAPVGFLVLDATGQILELNGMAREYFGLSENMLSRRSLNSFISPESYRSYIELMQAVTREGRKVAGADVRLRISGERQFWAHIQMSMIDSQVHGGRIVLCSVRNIDREKAAEQVLINAQSELLKQVEHSAEELEESEQRYRLLLNHANDAIIVSQLDSGRIVEANAQAARLLGVPVKALVGSGLDNLFPPGQAEQFLRSRMKEGEVAETALLRQQESGSVPVPAEVSSSQIEFAGKKFLLQILRDISERKQAEEALRQAKQRTDNANMALMTAASKAKRLAEEARQANLAKSSFLAAMSHEIRTPMNAIIGMTDIVLQSSLSQEQRRFLGIVRSSAGRLLDLINDILDLSKIEAGKLKSSPAPFALEESMRAVHDEMQILAAQKHLELHLCLEGRLEHSLFGDIGHLRQVLVNLIGNAVKFTDKGHVTFLVKVVEPLPRQVPEPARLYFQISDTGPGIPADKLDLLFKAFEQTHADRSRKGTGLGLSISMKLVQMMGGRIEVESVMGEGSRFSFLIQLPTTNRQPEDLTQQLCVAPEHGAAPSSADTPPPAVLLVDDVEANRLLARYIMEQKGWKVDEAENGRVALDMLAGSRYDVVLMDVEMPVMDGIEATRILREREAADGSHVPVVAMTAHALRGDKERLLAAGMDDYVSKPLMVKDFFAVVERQLPTGSAQA